MELVYKKCDKEDIEDIYRYTSRYVIAHEDPTMVDMKEALKLVRTKIEGNSTRYISVFRNGEKVGYYHLIEQIDLSCLLDNIIVFEHYRNNGIGTQIIHDILPLEERLYTYVYLSDTRYIHFLEKNDFSLKKLVSKSRAIYQRNTE